MILPALSQKFAHNGYEFSDVASADIPMIREWLRSPHLTDWWTPSVEDMADISSGLSTAAARYFLVSYQGRPYALIQCSDLGSDLVRTNRLGDDYPVEPGTFAIHQFVGDVEMLGFGHGTNFIKAFITELKRQPEVKRLMVTPAQDNAPAIKCYAQAGFRKDKPRQTPSGLCLLMVMPLA
ncbi:MAG: acetyltransferase [Alphaproteobacteria bacterium]|nr:acetyltransferase [Alphaproteobacteria bacterium]